MLYEIDLANAEARIVDYMADEQKMIHAYEGGRDPYRIVASEIFSVPYEKVSNEPKSSGFSEKSQRAVAKECKLALQYGMKHVTFAERADLPLNIAKRLREQYLNQICPNLRRVYWAYIESELRTKKAVTDLFGKTYRFYDRWGDQLLNAAYNFIPQSTVGRIINDWGLLPIWEGRHDKYAPVELLMQEHDSLKYQVRDSYPIEEHERILREIVASLERPLRFKDKEWVIPAEVAVGYNLGRWDKKKNPAGLKEIDLGKDLSRQLASLMK